MNYFKRMGWSILLFLPLAAPLAAADSLLIKNGWFITEKPGDKPFVGYMTVGSDGLISSIKPGEAPADLSAARTIDATGKMITPGFISAHSHLYSGPQRGIGFTETLYGWLQAWGPYNALATPDDIYWFTLHGSLDFLLNGITTAYDFTYPAAIGGAAVGVGEKIAGPTLKPGPYEEMQIKAKADAGLRFIDSISMPRVGTKEEMLARFDRLYHYAYDNYGKNPLFLKIALSGGLQRAPTKETAFLEAEVMKKYGILNQTHFLESPERVPEQQSKFYWYQEAGALGPNLIFGHFIQTNDDIVKIAGAAHASMSWQPTSNSRLASGVADIVKYRAAGMKVAVGLDNQSCTDLCDPFQNLRIGLALIRTQYKDAKALAVDDMLYLHTLGSAQVLGIADKVGSLEAGKYADFLIVDPRDPETGPVIDPVAHYVLACGLRNLKQVYVGGELIIDGTNMVKQDMPAIRKQIDERMGRIHKLVTEPTKKPTAAVEYHPADLLASEFRINN